MNKCENCNKCNRTTHRTEEEKKRLTKRLNIKHLFLFAPSIFNKPRLLSYYIKVYLYKLIKRIKPNSKLLKYFGSKDYKSLNNIMKATMSNVINYDLSKLIKEINQVNQQNHFMIK